MDRFAGMETFVRVVETGSITGAALRMEIAKSAVSRRLADLESRLGVQLFRRSTRRLSLTESGRSFYDRCVRVLADVDEAELSVSQEHGALRGKLRVALPLSFGLLHLSAAINDFMSQHPLVEFDRQVDLMQEGFDVAIRIAQLSDSSLIARRLAPIGHAVCASPSYFAAHGIPKLPDDLEQHVCLAYSNLPNPGNWAYQEPDGRSGTVKVPVKLKANNGDFLCNAAIAGQGVVMQPTFYVYDAIARGLLVPVLTKYTWPRLNAYAVYPPTRHLSTRVRAFVDFLAERFSGMPYWDQAMNQALAAAKKKAVKRRKAG
jgi:DNA-binding transcriptional LysR family regulator